MIAVPSYAEVRRRLSPTVTVSVYLYRRKFGFLLKAAEGRL